MASQPPSEALRGVARPGPTRSGTTRADRARTQATRGVRRGWFSPSLTALAISALGLTVAGSVGLTPTAQGAPGDTSGGTHASTSLTPVYPAGPQSAAPTASDPPTDPALAPFTTIEGKPAAGVGSPALRAARVKERAAQRAERLAENAEAETRAAHEAISNARQQNLSAAERSRQRAAAKIADENLRKAIAIRIAAAAARVKAEAEAAAQAAQNQSPVDPVNPAPPVVETGGSGVAPVAGAVVGSHFGDRGSWSSYHTGLDFRAAYGVPIRAVKSGVVLYAGNSGNWAGNHVAIKHADGITTMSSHMSSMAVHAGDTVRTGQVIGYVGQTGRAFGPHLHFEVYPVGVQYGDVYRAVNPIPWLLANGVQTH